MSEQSSEVPYKVGEVCWLEIPASDMARAQHFYKTVFGWEFKAETYAHMPEGSYALFSKPGTKLQGGMPLVKAENLLQPEVDASGEGQTTMRIVIMVEEVGAALKGVEAAGGKIICEKREAGPEMGYWGRFRDTEGNVNGVWSLK